MLLRHDQRAACLADQKLFLKNIRCGDIKAGVAGQGYVLVGLEPAVTGSVARLLDPPMVFHEVAGIDRGQELNAVIGTEQTLRSWRVNRKLFFFWTFFIKETGNPPATVL